MAKTTTDPAVAILSAIGASDGKSSTPATKKSKEKPVPENTLLNWEELKLKTAGPKDDVGKWAGKDFYLFTAKLYTGKFSVLMWESSWGYVNTFYKNLKKKLSIGMNAECNNYVMKAYIEFFFDRHINKVMQDREPFFIGKLDRDYFVADFCRFVQDHPVVVPAVPKARKPRKAVPEVVEKAVPEKKQLAVKEIAGKAAISDEALVTAYGLVIAGAYKIFVQRISALDGWSMIEMAAIRAVKKNRRFWANIKSATEKYGPYPSEMVWMNLGHTVESIGSVAGVKLAPVKVDTYEGGWSEFLRQ